MKKAHIILDTLILITLLAMLIFGLMVLSDIMGHLG
jgi:hypothetical protein